MAGFGQMAGVAAPKAAMPQVPTVAQNPVGRPPGPTVPTAGQPPPKAPSSWAQAIAPTSQQFKVAVNPNPNPPSLAQSNPTQNVVDTVQARRAAQMSGQPAPAPTPAPTAAPAPAPVTPTAAAPSAAVPGVQALPAPYMNPATPTQAPAAPIGTPPTAASTPIANSPWKSEQTWGAIGALGDAELDTAVKRAALEGLQKNPFGDQALAQENARSFDLTAAQGRSAAESIAADAARRGLGSSGVGAELAAEAGQNARNTYAQAARENAIGMREKGATYSQNTLAQAQSLAKDLASRNVDLENLRMQREGLAQQLAAQSRGGGGGGNDNLVTIMNPDGTETQVDLRLLDLVLGMEEGGMWG